MVQLGIPILRMMRISTLTRALAAMVLLTSCSLQQLPQQEEVLQRALPEGTELPGEWQTKTSDKSVVDGWLKSLNDPQLEAIVSEAIAHNLDLRQASERVLIAQQIVIVAGAKLLPQVGASIGARALHDEEKGSTDSGSLFIGLDWELDIWGKLQAKRAAQEEKYQATALEYAYARQSLAATVAKTWYLTIEARLLSEIAEEAVAVFNEQLKLVKIRQAAGKDSNLNIVDTRAKLESAQSNVQAVHQAYSDLRRALELLLGRYPAAEIDVAATFPELPPPPAAGIPASLLERRPDIIAAERLVLSAFRSEEAAKLALRPDFSFSLGTGFLDSSILTLIRLNPWLALASIGASMPVYEGGELDAMVEIATAQQRQAVANYGNVVLQAFSEVETALSKEKSLATRLPLEDKAVRDRKEAADIANTQYKLGRKDLLWVTNLREQLFAAQAAQVKLRGAFCINRIALLLALGGSFDTLPAITISPLRIQ